MCVWLPALGVGSAGTELRASLVAKVWPARCYSTRNSLGGTKSYVTLLLAHLPRWPLVETLILGAALAAL